MKFCKFILTFCISIFIALIGWYYFVYKSFYRGYFISEDNQSWIVDTVSSEILKSSVDDNTKKEMLDKLFENVPAKIIIRNISENVLEQKYCIQCFTKIIINNLSNNTVFYTKDMENVNEFIAQTLFVMRTNTDKRNYEVRYISYSEPKLICAIKRAICMEQDLVQKKVIKSDEDFFSLFDKIRIYYYNHILATKFWLLVILIMMLIYINRLRINRLKHKLVKTTYSSLPKKHRKKRWI